MEDQIVSNEMAAMAEPEDTSMTDLDSITGKKNKKWNNLFGLGKQVKEKLDGATSDYSSVSSSINSFSFIRSRSRSRSSRKSGDEDMEAYRKNEELDDDELDDDDSTPTEDLDNVDGVKYKSLKKVLEFPVVKDTYDWVSNISQPYLDSVKVAADPAWEKVIPVLDKGLTKLDQVGYKNTFEERTKNLSETIDNAAWKLLDSLAKKCPVLLEPTEHFWQEIKVRFKLC